MKTHQNSIYLGDKCISQKAIIPESLLEKFIGLRMRKITLDTSMLFILSRKKLIYEVFDTFLCEPIGYLAIDMNGVVIKMGVMKSNRVIGIKCSYWLEIAPEMIYGLNNEDRLMGLN